MKKSIVIALTLASVALTRFASADAAPTSPPAPSAATASTPSTTPSTELRVVNPLALRPSKPLSLSDSPAQGPSGTLVKVVAAAVLMSGAVFALRFRKKKSRAGVPTSTLPELRVLRRTSLGQRAELVLVDVDGQQILLGVTAQNVQLLTSLGMVEADGEPRGALARDSVPRDTPSQGERFAALLRATGAPGAVEDNTPPSAPRRASRPSITRERGEPELEGQVRALATWTPRR